MDHMYLGGSRGNSGLPWRGHDFSLSLGWQKEAAALGSWGGVLQSAGSIAIPVKGSIDRRRSWNSGDE